MENKIHAGSIADLQMSTDGTHFVTASFDNLSKLVDTQTLEVRCMVHTHASGSVAQNQFVRAVYAFATLLYKQACIQVVEHACYCSELLRCLKLTFKRLPKFVSEHFGMPWRCNAPVIDDNNR